MQARFRAVLLARVEQPQPGLFDPQAELVAVLAEDTLDVESVRRAIRALGMSQKAFAAAVGRSEGRLCQVLGGAQPLAAEFAKCVRAFLEAKAGWGLTDTSGEVTAPADVKTADPLQGKGAAHQRLGQGATA
jgi:hypothetical protein